MENGTEARNLDHEYAGDVGTFSEGAGSALEVSIALSITGSTLQQCASQWEEAVQAGPDLVEWRLDFLGQQIGREEISVLATKMRAQHGRPVIATYRTTKDGGQADFATPAGYRDAVEWTASWADYVDVEISIPGGAQLVEDLAPRTNVVASFHDFTSRPSTGVTRQLLEHMQDLGAAVAKVAWMVKNEDDLALVQALQQWAAANLTVPSVIIGMGQVGKPSRLGDSARLSAFTFARIGSGSAPGQPTVEEVTDSLKEPFTPA